MRKQIEKLVRLFPIEGMALHGTSYEKALKIKQDGLIETNYTPPTSSPLPHSSMQNSSRTVSEMLHRTIGSISLSARYGGARGKLWSDGSLTEGQLPAIVIFGGFSRPRDEGYDSNYLVRRLKVGAKAKHHTSFGKSPGSIKAEHIEQIVRITKEEQMKILESIEMGPKQNVAMQGLLIKKTLHAIRDLVKKKNK
ncbi:MAG: hypothetical protein AABY04_04720 [Candidatus Micrarchaeota archaeon]|mgnify:CR=1 FL=1